MKQARKNRRWHANEPLPDPEDCIDWGGETIIPVGFTEGGAPYGLWISELREVTARFEPHAGWVRAKAALQLLACAPCGTLPEVGWVRRQGQGISRDVFAAEVSARRNPDWRDGVYAVLVPRHDAPAGLNDRALHEAALLARLTALQPPVRIPRVAGVIRDVGGSLILVREFLAGMPLDLRAGRMHGRPWEVVAEVAAAVHRLPTGPLEEILEGPTTRRRAGEQRIRALFARSAAADALASEALAWLAEHLPPDLPATLVHGDLLGQNLLLDVVEGCALPAVIDWEYACRGDPAYDLAVVTRGVRRPFQVEGGLRRLLDAYNARSPHPLAERDVQFHEVLMHLDWCADVEAEGRRRAEQRQLLAGLLRRLS